MTLLWLVTGLSLAAALVAWRQARRTAQRLEQLTAMYWELKYQYGEQRVQLQRLAGGEIAQGQAPGPAPGSAPGSAQSPPARTATDSFVPLASLKR